MKFEDFIAALYECGWRPVEDAQHEQIRELFVKLWPVIAELEEALHDASE